MSSPWGTTAAIPAPCNLEDVMSEQLASEMNDGGKDTLLEEALAASKQDAGTGTFLKTSATTEMSDEELAIKLATEEAGGDPSDELIARYLQKQFDEEYDKMVDQREKQFNGTSKVSVSFENYKMKSQRQSSGQQLFEEGEEDSDYEEEFPEFPAKTNWETGKPVIGPRGYAGQGKNIVTKHDKVNCGRRNAERLMEMPPGFEVGDGEAIDMQLSNRVYNKLKTHNVSETKKSHKVHEKKDHSTAIKAVDEKTRIVMFKLINSGYLASVQGVVSEGKEAVVFSATGGLTKDENPVPQNLILKVMKTTMAEFQTRAKYVYGDHILSKDKFKKQNPRKVMKLWAEKEFLNLKRMRRHKLPCPTPLLLKKQILVMTCIGGNQPAPKLKDVRLSPEDYEDAYDQTVKLMKKMYHECGLIHADLSAFNLLWHDDTVWVIDVSQSVERENDNAHDFLLRDCQNICDFFKKAGVHNVSSPEDLFMDITNYALEGEGKVFATQVQRYDKDNYSFDYFFEQSEQSRSRGIKLSDSSEDEEEEEEEEVNERLKAGEEETEKSPQQQNVSQSEGSSVDLVGNQGKKASQKSNASQRPGVSDRWVIDSSDCS